MAKNKPLIVEQDPNEPVPKKLLAKQVLALSDACRSLLSTGLTDDDLAVLLVRRSRSKFGLYDASNVIVAIKQLGKDYAIKP